MYFKSDCSSNKVKFEFIIPATALGIILFLTSISTAFSQIDNNNTSSNMANWTTYTNNDIGFSFDYPSDWNIVEKTNRFETTTPDVEVSQGETSFSVGKAIDRPEDNPIKSSRILQNTRLLEEGMPSQGYSIVEHTDVKEYKIGGESTGTFLLTFGDGLSQKAMQVFFVIRDGDGYMINFKDSTQTFDAPETQNTLDMILKSFKFIN